MTPDEIAKGLDDADQFSSGADCSFCGSDFNVQFVTIDQGPREGRRALFLCAACRSSPLVKVVREDLDDKDQFTTYKIRTICGWCKKPLGEKPTNDPKMDGKISHGMCRDCEIEQYRQLGMEPPIHEGLDDKDIFERPEYCDRCNEPFRKEELKRIDQYESGWDANRYCAPCIEIINQGPSDDNWLKMYESLDDKDEFIDGMRCERCNSTDWVEPAYFNDTVENLCRWCKKALFTESLEDADEFGYVKATAGYEESGIDDSKHVFIFEDGARLYQDAKIVDKGYGETDVQYRVVLKLPDGSVHRSDTLKYSEQDLPPPFNVYMDGVYAFIREGDILPFTPELLKEFNSIIKPNVMESIAEDLDDSDSFQDKNAPMLEVYVKWPEGKFASDEEAVAAAASLMGREGYDITLEDIYVYRPKSSLTLGQNPGPKYEKVKAIFFVTNELVNLLKDDGDLSFGSTQREPWVALSIDVSDNEWIHPPQRDYDDDERPRRTGYRLPGYSWDESIAEYLDDADEFGEPPFIYVTITDTKLSAKDAIARTIDILKNPRSFSPTHMRGWDVTGIEVTGYSVSDSVRRPDERNTPSYDELENIPGALEALEGRLQHNEPLLARPELAFTDSFNNQGLDVRIYVGY